ncbi:MAG: PAS domain-containing protein [Chryseosolibacter sp.]
MGNQDLDLTIFKQPFGNLLKEAPFSATLLNGKDFKVEMANDMSLKIWGKDNSIVGKPLLEAIPELKGQPVYETLQEVYQTGRTHEGRERAVYLEVNGARTKRYFNFVYKPIKEGEETVTGIFATGYDVTDQVVTRQNLQESEMRVRLSIDAVGLGMYDRHYETNELITSSRFNHIFGFDSTVSTEQYINRIHPEDRHFRDAAHETALKTGRLSYECRLLLPDDSIRWIRINGVVLFNGTNEPVRLVGTGLDITDEKHAIFKLQESEERFRTLISETPEVGAGLYIGKELRIQYVNDVMLKFWNKDSSIIGKTMKESLPVLEGQPFIDQLEKVYTTGVPFIGREVKAILEVDGQLQPVYFNYTYKALRNQKGDIYAIHHMAVDVSEQVRHKLALMESEETVKRLFEQTPVGIAVFRGRSLTIEMPNQTILNYWGRTLDEVINKPLAEALPEIAQQRIIDIAHQVLDTGVTYVSPETPVNVYRNDKMETLIVRFAFVPQRDPYGNIAGILGIANDVTDLVNSRKKAEKNEVRLQNLANSMPQVVWIAEHDGAVTYYNNRVNQLAGVHKDGSKWVWEATVHPDDLDPTTKAYREAIENISHYQVEHRILMKDGSYRWHLSRAYPFDSDEGIKWYGTATDVHDQKILEMELENLVRHRTLELRRSNEDLQQFAHVASHDLKEPIRKIKTFSHKLKDEFHHILGERGNNFVSKILHSTERMYSMINGVLEYSTITSSANNFVVLDLNQVINNIVGDLEVLIQEKNAVIRYGNLHPVKGIPDLIYQLFYNLINNSLKFANEGTPPIIEIKSSELELKGRSYTEILISDNGIGFDDKFAEQIFITFFRLHSKDKYEGTGLGLALCKKIIERHGGSIHAKGNKGQGAQFQILIP